MTEREREREREREGGERACKKRSRKSQSGVTGMESLMKEDKGDTEY